MRSILAAALILVGSHAWARNEAWIVGGGCEKIQESRHSPGAPYADTAGPGAGYFNLFRPQFEAARGSLLRNGWSVRTLYDDSTWQRPWPGAASFDRKTFLTLFEKKIKKSAPGDQLLLAIATHGSRGEHAICLGDGTMLPVKELVPYLRQLRAKGVKVAVLDDSCYSGASVDILASTGACVMAGSQANTTSMGDAIWPNIFGLGMPEGASIPSFYVNNIADGPADIGGDGRVSAAEAFQFARLHNIAPAVPRISDCKLARGSLAAILKKAAPLLRPEIGMLQESEADGKLEKVSESASCAVARLPTVFRQLAESATIAQRARLAEELEFFGRPEARDPGTVLAELEASVASFRSLIHGAVADQRRADIALASGGSVPRDLRNRLHEMESSAYELRSRIRQLLQPLLHLACARERESGPPEPTSCEAFDLFPVRSAS